MDSLRAIASFSSLLFALTAACTSGGDGDDDGGGDGDDNSGGDGSAFVGLWQYRSGSAATINCPNYGQQDNDLGGQGFQVVSEDGGLVRVGVSDGTRFSLEVVSSRHVDGVAGEEQTIEAYAPNFGDTTTLLEINSLRLELDSSHANQMREVLNQDAEVTTWIGTMYCQIAADNTLDRVE